VHMTMHFAEEAWGIVSLLLLLWLGVIGWMRDRALRIGQVRALQVVMFPWSFFELTCLIATVPEILLIVSSAAAKTKLALGIAIFVAAFVVMWFFRKPLRAASYWWVEGHAFLFLYILAGTLLSLPLDLYEQHLELKYALSVQSWGSWFGDQAKAFGMTWVGGGLLLMLLFWIIRKFPQRWWLVFWLCTIPVIFFGIFVSPYIEPAFNKYEPLTKTNPGLVAKLEEVVQKGNMNIPPERMFLMKASAKVTTLNADVEGFGASKRVVVWDNTITKATPDEIVMVFGHESGHYVLGHIAKGLTFSIVLLLVTIYLGFLFVQWALRKFGVAWKIPAQEDWAALAVLLLAFSIFGAITEPMNSAYTRSQEHAADVYGQEAVHGIVANPQAAAQGAFDVLGETSLADPNPNQFYEFWTYSHPAIGRRAAFAKVYDPWAPGFEPKYFKK